MFDQYSVFSVKDLPPSPIHIYMQLHGNVFFKNNKEMLNEIFCYQETHVKFFVSYFNNKETRYFYPLCPFCSHHISVDNLQLLLLELKIFNCMAQSRIVIILVWKQISSLIEIVIDFWTYFCNVFFCYFIAFIILKILITFDVQYGLKNQFHRICQKRIL